MDYLSDIIGQTHEFLQALEVANKCAPTDSSVLITGETGTGKELFAKFIHENSKRKGKPLVTINCGEQSVSLMESKLFGHTKGAFTGALKNRVGNLKYADKGTLFLDEIGDMPSFMQSAILRAIEQKEFTPLGQDTPKSSDFRLICATNKNLKKCISQGSFREDLYYRINRIVIELPPLRSRKDDIPRLAKHFTKLACEKNQRSLKEFLPEALKALKQYSWPGNIRELINVCERVVILCEADKIDLPHLSKNISDTEDRTCTENIERQLLDIADKPGINLKIIEKILVKGFYEKYKGNQSKAAKELGMKRTTYWRRLKEHGVI